MPLTLKVEWIKTDSDCLPHGRLTHIGGKAGKIDWEHAIPLAIQYLEQDTFQYYATMAGQTLRFEIEYTSNGNRHLKLTANKDVEGMNLLLMLPVRNLNQTP
jgi:hypothetical protein